MSPLTSAIATAVVPNCGTKNGNVDWLISVKRSNPPLTGMATSACPSPSRSPVAIPPPVMTSVGSAAYSDSDRVGVCVKIASVSANAESLPNATSASLRPSPSTSAMPTDCAAVPKSMSSDDANRPGCAAVLTETVYDAVLAFAFRTRRKYVPVAVIFTRRSPPASSCDAANEWSGWYSSTAGSIAWASVGGLLVMWTEYQPAPLNCTPYQSSSVSGEIWAACDTPTASVVASAGTSFGSSAPTRTDGCGAAKGPPSAASGSTMPWPKAGSTPGRPRSRAVLRIWVATWDCVHVGCLPRRSAATPATIGDENDVPESEAYSSDEPSAVEVMSRPGATTSTRGP